MATLTARASRYLHLLQEHLDIPNLLRDLQDISIWTVLDIFSRSKRNLKEYTYYMILFLTMFIETLSFWIVKIVRLNVKKRWFECVVFLNKLTEIWLISSNADVNFYNDDFWKSHSKTLKEKEKILITNIFSFSHNVISLSKTSSMFWVTFILSSAKGFWKQYGKKRKILKSAFFLFPQRFHPFKEKSCYWTLSHTSPAVQVFWKHCGKRRNCLYQAISPFPTVFATPLENFLPFSSNLK